MEDLPQRPKRNLRPYYSQRRKHGETYRLNMSNLKASFRVFYDSFNKCGYFTEAFGQHCVDGFWQGYVGDVDHALILMIQKSGKWPISEKAIFYSEEDIFDMIEFLFDHVSKPIDGYIHTFNDCGWHFKKFEKLSGQQEFRDEINEILRKYEDGFYLSELGYITHLGNEPIRNLCEAKLPGNDPENIDARVKAATEKFRRYQSSTDDRRDAVRDLFDVLEFLRPKLKHALKADDERDLFNIANNFGVRHHNQNQKNGYDKSIWLSWMFHFNLATIHAALRLIEKNPLTQKTGTERL